MNQARSDKSPSSISTKQMRSSEFVSRLHKEWARNLRERVSRGEPFAITNVSQAEEIFTAMDILYIPTQWWSAYISAKRLSPYYFDLLGEKGYDLCRYCSLPLGCTMDNNPERAPWGGLPKPVVIVSGDTHRCRQNAKIMELWAREYGVPVFPLEETANRPYPSRWWEKAVDHWNEIIEPHRLDLRVEELKALIKYLEVTTGKTFSQARLTEVAELANEMQRYFRKARDLIAGTIPCPASIPDQFAVYAAEYHRGTQKGLDAVKMFYEEVKERVAKGESACPNEKIRLLWYGWGLWGNTAFYQYFEEKYGAVFVSAMLIDVAAEIYARTIHNGDTLRALASRGLAVAEPTDWWPYMARLYKCAGVVQTIPIHCHLHFYDMESRLGTIELQNEGVPVCRLYCDPVDAREWDDDLNRAKVSSFIESLIK